MEDNNCCICYSKLENNNITIFHCNHKFHLSCIIKLYNQKRSYSNKCPMCRTSFYKEVEYDSESDSISESSNIPDLVTDDDVIEYNNMPRPPMIRSRAVSLWNGILESSQEIEEERNEVSSEKSRYKILLEKIDKYKLQILLIVVYISLTLLDYLLPNYIKRIIRDQIKYMIISTTTILLIYIYRELEKSDTINYLRYINNMISI